MLETHKKQIMKNIYLKGLFLVVLCSVIFSSCLDKDLFDRDKWSDRVEWKPDYTVPAGYITYNMDDLVKDSIGDLPLAGEDESEYLALKLEKPDFFVFNIDSVVSIPDVQPVEVCNVIIPTTKRLTGSVISMNKELPMSVYKSSVDIESFRADININITRLGFPVDCDLEISFPGISGAGLTLPFTKTLNIGDKLDETISLTNVDIDCSLGSVNKLDVVVKVTLNSDAPVGTDEIDFNLQVSDCVVRQANGKFGELPLIIEPDILPFKENTFDLFDFHSARIKLISKYNEMHVPFAVDAIFTGKAKDGREVNIRDAYPGTILRYTGNNHDLVFGGSFEPEKEEINQYDNTNSDLEKMLLLPPGDGISYSGNVILNYNSPGNTNFIKEDSEMHMDMQMEIPLLLKEEGITFKDTLVDIDISSQMTKQIEALSMNILFLHENYPLHFEIKRVLFYDESENLIEELKGKDDSEATGGSAGMDEGSDGDGDTTGDDTTGDDSSDDAVVTDDDIIKEVYKNDVTKSKYILQIPRRIIDRLEEVKHVGLEIRLFPADRTTPIPYGLEIEMKVSFGIKLDLSKN